LLLSINTITEKRKRKGKGEWRRRRRRKEGKEEKKEEPGGEERGEGSCPHKKSVNSSLIKRGKIQTTKKRQKNVKDSERGEKEVEKSWRDAKG